jgi:hypothetical protein
LLSGCFKPWLPRLSKWSCSVSWLHLYGWQVDKAQNIGTINLSAFGPWLRR